MLGFIIGYILGLNTFICIAVCRAALKKDGDENE